MEKSKLDLEDPTALRRKAEEQFGARPTDSVSRSTTPSEMQRLLHELQVHQIELEMQNEELQSSRSEAEEALHRYTELYEFAPIGYLTLARGGEIRQINLAGSRLLGLERSHLVGKRLASLVEADSRPVFTAFLNNVFGSQGKAACEVVVRPELALPIAVEFAATAIAGAIDCRVVARDITERKRAETLMAIRLRLQELASSHSAVELLQKTLDEIEVVTGSRMGFLHYLDADQNAPSFQIWSSRAISQSSGDRGELRAFGGDRDGVLADCIRKRAPVINNHCEGPPNRTAATGREPMLREVVVPVFRHEKIVAIMGMGNKGTAYTAEDVSTISTLADIAWEIAERRRAEQEREELQLQLAQAQKMEAIGTLAGGIAHDFNNILAGILGGLTLVELDTGDDSGSTSDIYEMKALVSRGAALTQQLLGFAREGKYNLKPLDLSVVVAKTSAMYGRARADITIQTDLAPDLLAVFMDHSQLEQALLNLFVNAGQAMPDGGRLLLHGENAILADEKGTLVGVPPGRYVRLLVSDTGSGMDAKTMSRIFEPFFTTKAPGQGTGLGLASVYGIIKNHAGFIGVESEIGKGTTFTLLLPATERTATEERTPTPVLQRGTGTILVIDDEPQVLKVCSRLLQKLGYQVLTATGGSQAIELVREQGSKLSLVVLDMTMPEMSGRQTYETLRKLLPGIKVLLSSGYRIEGQAQALLDSGCNGFIQKPFDAVALSAKVQALLQPSGLT